MEFKKDTGHVFCLVVIFLPYLKSWSGLGVDALWSREGLGLGWLVPAGLQRDPLEPLTAWSDLTDMRRDDPCVYIRWDWDTTLARLRPLLSTTELLVPPVLPELVLLVRMRPGWRETQERDERMSRFFVSVN